MKRGILFFSFIFLVFSCGKSVNEISRGEVLVRVKDRVLTREEVEVQIPKGIYPADSLIRAENLVKKWIVDELMDNAAYHNIGDDKSEIDILVDEYRRSLMRHRFQERIIKDKVMADIREAEEMAYFKENKAMFVLNVNLIKGFFLKIPVDAPGLDNVRKWYVSDTDDALEKIEKYSIQNAIIYDYFYDYWVTFDDIMAKIPQKFSNPTQFLRTNNYFEVKDSTHIYFLNVSDKLLVGNEAPFDYVKVQIQNILINKRKVEYLREFGENLYRDAIRNGTVKYTAK